MDKITKPIFRNQGSINFKNISGLEKKLGIGLE